MNSQCTLKVKNCGINAIPEGNTILDVPPIEIANGIRPLLGGTKTVMINGTTGFVDHPLTRKGTKSLIKTLNDFKTKNAGIRLIGLGGDGVPWIIKTLGKERAQENFDLFTGGGMVWQYFSRESFPGEKLLALRYIDRIRPVRIMKGMIDYSCLKSIMDIPDEDWPGKTVCLVVDLNGGKTSGGINPEEMIKVTGIIDTLVYILMRGVKKIIILSHNAREKDYKRPKESPDGTTDPDYTLAPFAPLITNLLYERGIFEIVEFVPDCLKSGNRESLIELRENTRFYRGETSKDPIGTKLFTEMLQKSISADIFVNDACAAYQREESSKAHIANLIFGHHAIGLLGLKELTELFNLATNAERPFLAIFQGAKVDEKILAIENFVAEKIADNIAILGKIAVPFITERPDTAKIMALSKKNGVNIILPKIVTIAKIPEGMNEEDFIKSLK